MDFVWFILIGILAGFLAGLIMKGKGFGLWINLLVGIVGGVLGGWIFSLLKISYQGLPGQIICSTIGAVVLLFIVSLVKKK